MKKRRVLIKETYEREEYKDVKNPLFDPVFARECIRKNLYYDIPQFIEVLEKEKVTEVIGSAIEYQIKCEVCQTKAWKRRKAKYCSTNCRVMAHREKKKQKK